MIIFSKKKKKTQQPALGNQNTSTQCKRDYYYILASQSNGEDINRSEKQKRE